MAVKVGLGLLHLLGIDEAHVADAAIGKGINHRTTDKQRQHIVDDSADKCSQRGNHDNHHHIHVTVAGGKVGRWRYYHFAREGNKR